MNDDIVIGGDLYFTSIATVSHLCSSFFHPRILYTSVLVGLLFIYWIVLLHFSCEFVYDFFLGYFPSSHTVSGHCQSQTTGDAFNYSIRICQNDFNCCYFTIHASLYQLFTYYSMPRLEQNTHAISISHFIAAFDSSIIHFPFA